MPDDPTQHDPTRRSFSIASAAMAGGLAAGYGTMGWVAFEFLKPQRDARTAWMFVRPLKEFGVGESLRYRAPDGATINITRRGSAGTAEDFKALSSVCPHLGCQVHWEPQNNRYFCPCHNGVFDPEGKGTGGPPGDSRQSLGSYPLRVQDGLLFIEVGVERLADAGPVVGSPVFGSPVFESPVFESPVLGIPVLEELPADRAPRGPGHDPCLGPCPRKGRPA